MHKITEHAGQLNERVTITRDTQSADGAGGFTSSWATYATVWAKVMAISGKERDMANQTESPRNYRFIVRRSDTSAGITTKDRITWRSKIMNIRFIADEGPQKEFLYIDAESGVAA